MNGMRRLQPSRNRLAGALALWVSLAACVFAADPPISKLKDEMRQPWERGDTFFIRGWKVARAFRCDLARDCLDIPGGEAVAKPNETQKRADGGPLSWVRTTALETHAASAPPRGERDDAVAYAATIVERAAAGKAVLSVGSTDGVRV